VTVTIGPDASGQIRARRHVLQKDRLGSVVRIVGDDGSLQRKSYDAFGKPRDADLTDYPLWHSRLDFAEAPGIPAITKRGFTGHEHLDDLQLVHMNGRVYDFNNGRFLNVDTFIQNPGSTQSLNPYTYVFNNPLSGVDPSGYVSRGFGWESVSSVCISGLGCLGSNPSAKGKDDDDKQQWTNGFRFQAESGSGSRPSEKEGQKKKKRPYETGQDYCDVLGPNNPRCKGSAFQNGLEEVKKGFDVVTKALDDKTNLIPAALGTKIIVKGGKAIIKGGKAAKNAIQSRKIKNAREAVDASKIKIKDNRAKKIFGERDGHLPDTPQNRRLLQDIANDPETTLGPDKHGNIWSAKILDDGTQVWTQTRNGEIINGGLNKTPRVYNPETGLSAPTRPNWK